MVEWLLKELTGSTTYPILNGETFHIHKTLNGLNSIPSLVTTGTTGFGNREYVAILNESSVEVFRGYTTGSDTDTNNYTETYEIMESAMELGEILIEQPGGTPTIYESVFTNTNPTTRLTDIMYTASDWTTGTTDATTISTFTYLDFQDVLTGVFTFIRDIGGRYVWFVDNGSTKKVYWTTTNQWRTDRTGLDLVNTIYYNKRILNATYKQDIQKVVVVGNTSNILGAYDSGASGKSIAYNYPEAKTNAECVTRATQIHAEATADSRSQILLVLPTTVEYDEGDKVTVDGSPYIVYEVDRYIHKMEISCDNGYEAPAYQQKIRRADKVVNASGGSNTAWDYATIVSDITGNSDAIDAINGITIGSATEGGNLRTGIWTDA